MLKPVAGVAVVVACLFPLAACDPKPSGYEVVGAVGTTEGVITQGTTMFAVIDAVDGDQLTLHMLHSAMSRDGKGIVFVGDEIRARVLPLEPGNTRRAVCATAIVGQEGKAVPVSGPPVDGCVASVNDFRGRVGLPVDEIAVDTVTWVSLTGDIVMNDPK
ncbi:hypothetical protein [Rhodospirillum sp. A1_3_36]|uniref:hypothetical protein n=1 Tax=Rhodospirillum sp. A1_3_36 TaxID=3391666 RepID=UPI0039A6341F